MNLLREYFTRAFKSSRLRARLNTAKQAYTQAKDAYDSAWDRGDTRAVHEAWKAMHLAKNALIRAEIALRTAQPRRPSYSAKPATAGDCSRG